MSVRPGTRLDGRYRLVERLAYGGMGEVWRAADEVLSREVAVKILRPELAEDEAFVRRFRAEARTTSGLPHNGIAAVYDYGETRVGADGSSPAPVHDEDADPVAYLVMELVPGEALSTTLSRDGALTVDLTLDLVAQAARALHAAHQRGVIHRDIKPANLMVTPDGRVKVTDFGIARPVDHEPLTATGQVMGTAHYLAPELAKGQDASPLSDVYALGVVAYECLAGHRPFEGDNQVAVALAHLNEQPPPLPATISGEVRSVVGSAMEKEPTRRMPSAEAFAAALETIRFRQTGDEHHTAATGILPNSAAAAGLAAAGLLGTPAEDRGWTPGVHRSGAAGSPGAPPPGTHILGPAGTPPGTGPSGTLLGGPSGGYGDYDPGGPFRNPTAPGGISVTPDRRRGTPSGIILAAAALILGLIIIAFFVWLGSGNSRQEVPTAPPTSAVPTAAPPSSTSASSTSSTKRHRTQTSTTSTSTTTSTTSSTTSRTTDTGQPSDTGGQTGQPTNSTTQGNGGNGGNGSPTNTAGGTTTGTPQPPGGQTTPTP